MTSRGMEEGQFATLLAAHASTQASVCLRAKNARLSLNYNYILKCMCK